MWGYFWLAQMIAPVHDMPSAVNNCAGGFDDG